MKYLNLNLLFLFCFTLIFAACKKPNTAPSDGESEAKLVKSWSKENYDILLVGSRDDHADLNIILTINRNSEKMILHSMQRDYLAKGFEKHENCKKGLKLTDNLWSFKLSAPDDYLNKYAACLSQMVNARQKKLLDILKNTRKQTGLEKDLRLKDEFKIDAVLLFDMGELSKILGGGFSEALRIAGLSKADSGRNWAQRWYTKNGAINTMCHYFRNVFDFFTSSKDDTNWICSFFGTFKVGTNIALDKLMEKFKDKNNESRVDKIFKAVKHNVKIFSGCAQFKLRERGSPLSELEQQSCRGHLPVGNAYSFQREANAAILTSELLGYMHPLRKNRSGLYESITRNLYSKLGKTRSYEEMHKEFGDLIKKDRFRWNKGKAYGPIPIIIWDGKIPNNSGGPTSEQEGVSGRYVLYQNGKVSYEPRSKENKNNSSYDYCRKSHGFQTEEHLCDIRFPTGQHDYSNKDKKELRYGARYGWMPWMIPPPIRMDGWRGFVGAQPRTSE